MKLRQNGYVFRSYMRPSHWGCALGPEGANGIILNITIFYLKNGVGRWNERQNCIHLFLVFEALKCLHSNVNVSF